ncbi:MAG: carboxymuconolactone decarboxylase family protein [Candidatus Dormibacteria bacterium]
MAERQRPRVHLRSAFPEGFAAITQLGEVVDAGGLDPALVELVRIRASQINGCAFCLDKHTKEARARGETEQRLHILCAWRDTALFDERERAALELTEMVTMVADAGIDDDDIAAAREHFDERELVRLLFVIASINAWNRLAIAARTPVDGYVSRRVEAG